MKHKYSFLISATVLALCLVFTSGCSFISISLSPATEPLRETTVSGRGKEKVLIIDISGIISEERRQGLAGLSEEPDMVARIKEELKMAAGDKHMKRSEEHTSELQSR